MRFLFSYILCNCFIIHSYCAYIIPSAQKYLSNIISAGFPFKYPMNANTLSFGAIITNIWTWSIIKCPSIISTPIYWHNFLNISPKSSRYWLYIAFRLYLGVNTIWYLHIYFVCAKEFVFLVMVNPPSFLLMITWTISLYRKDDPFVLLSCCSARIAR